MRKLKAQRLSNLLKVIYWRKWQSQDWNPGWLWSLGSQLLWCIAREGLWEGDFWEKTWKRWRGKPWGCLEEEWCRQRESLSLEWVWHFERTTSRSVFLEWNKWEGGVGEVRSERWPVGTSCVSLIYLKDSGVYFEPPSNQRSDLFY